MRLALFPVFCLLSSAIAVPTDLAKREMSPSQAVARITKSLERLNWALKSLPRGGSSQEADKYAYDLLGMSNVVVEDFRHGSRDVRRGPNVNTAENAALLSSVRAWTSALQGTMDGWINAKQMIKAAGKVPVILDHLLTFQDAALSFEEAVANKLPFGGNAGGNSIRMGHATIIERAIVAYKRP